MPNDFLCLTVTSPPYNLGNKHHTDKKVFNAYDEYNDDLPENEYQEWQIKVLNELYRVTKQGGSVMYNHKNRIKAGKQITPYEWLLKTDWTIKQEIVWQNGTPNMDKCRFYPSTERIYWLCKGTESDFYNEINANDVIKDLPEGTDKEHKRSFPLKLAQRFILCFPNAKIIYDCFMGSGTTAIASLKEHRQWIGSEISKAYCGIVDDELNLFNSKPSLFFGEEKNFNKKDYKQETLL